MNYCAVITTINPPTKAIEEITKRIPAIVIGDEKTPEGWRHGNAIYYSGNGLDFSYLPPVNHYSRKNVGYLIAMQQGADCIYDTDDDNIPNENWKERKFECDADIIRGEWCNVYRYFTKEKIWPRGLPLDKIEYDRSYFSIDCKTKSPIQQGVADGSADVDAIYRLTLGRRHNRFEEDRSVVLARGNWCPFNSQSTWWFKEAFPLMYLPQYCSFRMTDIWRSFVAQRCLWEMGYGVVFHSPAEVTQERNPHDLMKDFEDEIPGYLNNDKIKIALDGLELGKDVYENMNLCYLALIDLGVLPKEEHYSLSNWIEDVKQLLK
jgi:hypothetical protein